MTKRHFTDPQPTLEAAQALYQPSFSFGLMAAFRTPAGYVLGRLRYTELDCTLQEAAAKVKAATGYEMVSYCDPVLGIWQPYEATE